MRCSALGILLFACACAHAPSQEQEAPLRRAPDGTCTIYLTFDDGPHYGTDDCLVVLRDEGIRATFFVCGYNFRSDMGARRIRWNQDIARRTWAEGHLTGNHSYSHAYGYGDVDAFVDDMTRNLNEFILLNAGTAPQAIDRIARLPGRNTWRLGAGNPRNGNDPVRGDERAVADRLQSAGYIVFGWDVEWTFVEQNGIRDPVETPQEMVDAVRSACEGSRRTRTAGKVVVLMHDNMFWQSRGNRQKLAEFIRDLKSLGYALETLDTY